jgi:WD40 repeat protein/nucleoside phosphorylase
MGRTRADVLIVTALKEELDAVLGLNLGTDEQSTWRLLRDRHEFPYHVREVRNVFGEVLLIAAAWSGEMGETAATARAVSLTDELEPECLAMCGICAGKRGKVFLGDVIVADRVFSYDHGKLIAGSEEDGGGFFHDITTYNLEASWRMEAVYFSQQFRKTWQPAQARPLSKQAQERWLLLTLHGHEQQGGVSPDKHPERKERCPGWGDCIRRLRHKGLLDPTTGVLRLTEAGKAWVAEQLLTDPDGQDRDPDFRVHVAPMATGKTVREDPELFRRLERHVRTVLGVEMEAAAIGHVSARLGRRSIIAKAVSDYGDLDKDDAFRGFACHASAAFLLKFLREYVRARETGVRPVRTEREVRAADADEESIRSAHRDRREEFLARVERATRLREPPGTEIIRLQGPAPFETYLEVMVRKGNFTELYPVGALERPIAQEMLEIFVREIHTHRYAWASDQVISTLVHVGSAASLEMARLAGARRVNLWSFAEYQGLLDFSEYLKRQTERLESDPVYPPPSYVDQRGKISMGGQPPVAVVEVLGKIREMLDSPDPRFALILGEFGTGKTFLLHELARRMGKEEGAALIPVLIEMRSLQKQRTLRELVAQHFASREVSRFEVEKFLYMLREGRIVLLFDGFDELALRVTYDQVLEHFRTLVEAAEGRAKVIVTSRTQHFLTDHQVKQELARRAEAIPGYRLVQLERFTEEQIRQFLVKRLGSEEAAAARLELLRDVKDLLGLSQNPRLLSFIVELEAEKLEEARKGSGEITSAKLYELLISKWLLGEHERVNPPGAPKGLSMEQLSHGVTALARLLWGRTERTVSMDELPSELFEVVSARGEHALDTEKVKHQLGSGSLLVRDEDGRFSFVHQSVMEWLVANDAALHVRERADALALGQREMSELMADFFVALAGREAARSWAEWKASVKEEEVAKRNAMLVISRLGPKEQPGQKATAAVAKNLEGSDLRGQDLSRADLRRANLRRANLSGVPLVEADLMGADLEGATLARAELNGAKLRDANLAGADLTGARLQKADLRGAKLQQTRLRMARLTGALVDSLKDSDVFGAALPEQMELEPQLVGDSAHVAVCFSPADGVLATGHEDGTIRLWDTATGTALRVLRGHTEAVTGLAFNPTGQWLASASEDATVMLWSVADGGLSPTVLKEHGVRVKAVAFSPDGEVLAAASDDGKVWLWDGEGEQNLGVLGGHDGVVNAVAFSPNGKLLASVSEDATVMLWDMSERRDPQVLRHAIGPVTGVSFSPDGVTLAVSSMDGTVWLWNMAEGGGPRALKGEGGPILGLAISPDGTMLASASENRSIQLWSLGDGRVTHELLGHYDFVQGVAFSPDGANLASVSDDGSVRLWDAASGRVLRVLEGGQASTPLRIACPSRGTLVCASDDASLTLWDMDRGQVSRVHEGLPDAGVSRGSFSPWGDYFAAVAGDAIEIRSVTEWRVVRVIMDHYTEAARGLAFSPNGEKLAVASGTGAISLWNIRTGKRLLALEDHRSLVMDLAISPDGALLAAASRDRQVLLWSLSDGRSLPAFQGHQGAVRSVAFSPNGRFLASASADATIRFWNVDNGRQLKKVKGSSRRLLFDPRGQILASISSSGRVALMQAEKGRPISILRGHSGEARDVAFSMTGETLAVAYTDGVVGIHEIDTGHCLARFLSLPEGWVALRSDGRFKLQGNIGAAFWYAKGLCRFEPHELSSVLPGEWRIPDDKPLLDSGD